MQGLIDCPWCSPCSEHDPDEADVRGVMLAERAVIEAAKAWLHEQIHDPNSVRNVTCQYTKGALGLTLAIEALQEVEGG